MKRTAQNNEIPHIWANYSNGYSEEYHPDVTAGSMSMEDGNKIYSYRACIGEMATYKGKPFCMLSISHYSPTTSNHQTKVRQSIPYGLPVFECEGEWSQSALVGFEPNFQKLRDKMINLHLENAAQKLANSKRRRDEYHKAMDIRYSNDELQKARDVASFFGSRRKLPGNVEQAASAIAKAEKAAAAKKRKANKDRLKKEIARQYEWIKGASVSPCYSLPVALRVRDGILETSQGARMPEKEARIAYKLFKAGKVKHGDSIGNFRLLSILDGVATIGCHKVMITEIERIATAQNWGA